MATRMYVCESVEHPASLLSGLNEQRLKGLLCDVTVRVQGHLFKAHINVLASAMGYFRDLFSKSMKEKRDGLIEIPIIVNSTGFAKILDFVYTSQLCLSQSTVMQVLCSACYLQIPYVVEKCQEFIGTHGHVTSPSSLSEVTGPLLQDLQRRNLTKPQPQVHASSASASLSLLSQLNRLSEKTRNRSAIQAKTSKTSPQRAQESDEQQECELINTPPSPGGRSNGDDHPSTPDPSHEANEASNGLKVSNVLSIKQERPDNDTSPNEAYSPQDRYTCNGVEEQGSAKKHPYSNHALDLGVGDLQQDRDVIDHKLLAEYFSTDRDKEPAENRNNVVMTYPLQLDTSQERGGQMMTLTPADKHIFTMTKNLNGNRMLENGSSGQQYTILQKKEKPKKEYRCDYCGKMFGRQQHLKRHILTHTGERPYPCQYCEKRFRRSEHLKHHLVSHEHAMGIESQPSRKRQRKVQRTDDAYSMSKMMLDTYGQYDADRNHPESGNIASAPVILPSMFTDADQHRSSPPQISELEDPQAPSNDHSDIRISEMNGHRVSPSFMEQSPMAALNLCRVSPKEPEAQSPSNAAAEETADNAEPNSDEGKPTENDHNSSGSLSPSNAYNSGFDENPVSSDIISMEGSEVLTHDLKRLIAAMDE